MSRHFLDDPALRRIQTVFPVLLLGPFAVIGFLLAERLDIKGYAAFGFAAAFAAAASLVVHLLSQRIVGAAASGIARFIFPSGDSTPYQPGFSFEESLAARDDFAGALAAYDARLAATPDDVEAHAAAAEMAIRAGEPARAVEWLAALRRIPGVSAARERYATQRLVDLHLGPLADEGRALVELRRIVERFPSSREAAAARDAIGRLKAGRG